MIINRVGREPFEFKRGDRVRFKDSNVTVIGISEARKMVRITTDKAVSKEGFEVYYSFIYPALPEVKPQTAQVRLSDTIHKVNRKNEPPGGWDEQYKVS